jgi:hypothetical protein
MITGSLADSYRLYVQKTSLEELRECWEAADENTRGGLDAAIFVERPDKIAYWWFYKQRKTLEKALGASDLDDAIAAFPSAWSDYKGGKDAAVGRLMGYLVKKGFSPEVALAALKERRNA